MIHARNICLIILLITWSHRAYGDRELPKTFQFNQKDALAEWEEKIFNNRVLYSVQAQAVNGYLSAHSQGAASGLIYRLKVNAQRNPFISWHWKVLRFPEKGSALQTTGKSGWVEKDDYAARVYVIFHGLNFMNIKTLEYVWDKDLPEGTILTSPYFKNIKIIVVQSGIAAQGEWAFEERNIYEDYRKAFGRSPGAPVGAIALMTDSDNTVSSAETEYKDIRIGYKKP